MVRRYLISKLQTLPVKQLVGVKHSYFTTEQDVSRLALSVNLYILTYSPMKLLLFLAITIHSSSERLSTLSIDEHLYYNSFNYLSSSSKHPRLDYTPVLAQILHFRLPPELVITLDGGI